MFRRLIRRFRRRPPPDATRAGWVLGGNVDPPRPPSPRGWQRVEHAPEPWQRRVEQARIEAQRERGREWWGRAEPDDGWRPLDS